MRITDQRANVRIREVLLAFKGSGTAAHRTLAAGVPVHYRDGTTPVGLLVCEQPDGRRTLVQYARGDSKVVRDL